MRTKARQIGVLPIVPMVAEWSVPKLPLVITLGNLRDYGTPSLCSMFHVYEIYNEGMFYGPRTSFFFSLMCVYIYICTM